MKLPINHQHGAEGERSSDNGIIPGTPNLLNDLFDQFKKLTELKKAFRVIILFIFICTSPDFCFSQSDSVHHKSYYALVDYTNGAQVKSLLYDISDSALILRSTQDSELLYLSYRFIEKIKIRKKGSVGTGILVGTGSGILMGTIIGAALYKAPEPTGGWGSLTYDPGQGGSAVAGGVLGAIGGLISGAIIGSLPAKTFKINHSYQNFLNAIPAIKRYCVKH